MDQTSLLTIITKEAGANTRPRLIKVSPSPFSGNGLDGSPKGNSTKDPRLLLVQLRFRKLQLRAAVRRTFRRCAVGRGPLRRRRHRKRSAHSSITPYSHHSEFPLTGRTKRHRLPPDSGLHSRNQSVHRSASVPTRAHRRRIQGDGKQAANNRSNTGRDPEFAR